MRTDLSAKITFLLVDKTLSSGKYGKRVADSESTLHGSRVVQSPSISVSTVQVRERRSDFTDKVMDGKHRVSLYSRKGWTRGRERETENIKWPTRLLRDPSSSVTPPFVVFLGVINENVSAFSTILRNDIVCSRSLLRVDDKYRDRFCFSHLSPIVLNIKQMRSDSIYGILYGYDKISINE